MGAVNALGPRELVRGAARPPAACTGPPPAGLALLIAAFGPALATLAPGVAQAAGEAVTGTLQTSKSGPIQGVAVTVETVDGTEVDSVDDRRERPVHRRRCPGPASTSSASTPRAICPRA